jgi:hypothetical protein
MMTTNKKIRVMISSRCTDKIKTSRGGQALLSDVRKELKRQIEEELWFDTSFLEVWINETDAPEEGSTDSWDKCLKEVDDADIVIVLYNGDAGWALSSGGIGICHAEVAQALSQAPAKVRLLEIEPLKAKPNERDNRFRSYVQTQSLFRGGKVSTSEQLLETAKQALVAAIVHQVQLGLREAKKGKYYLGAGLDWTKLNFVQRKEAIEGAIAGVLNGGSSPDRSLLHDLSAGTVVFSIHAIPDNYSTAEAREMVGRPFLSDHLLVNDSLLSEKSNHGPVHIIGVHKKMTESQARSFMGHANVIIVSAPFGYYLADRVEHSQTLIITDCRDETGTRHGIQRCTDWLSQSGEEIKVFERAKKRKAILKEIAKHAE